MANDRPVALITAASRGMGAACARALYYGDASYRRVKRILAAGLDQLPREPGPLQPELPSYEYARSVGDFFPEEVAPC